MSQPLIMVMLSLLASVCFCVATYALPTENKQYRLRRELFATLCFAASAALDALSLKFGSVTLKSALGILNIIIAPLLSICKGQRAAPGVQVGVAIAGCLMCIFSQFPTHEDTESSVVRSRWQTDETIGLVTSECILAMLCALCTYKSYFAKRGFMCIAAGIFSSIGALLLSTYFRLCPLCSEEEAGLLWGFATLCTLLFYFSMKKGKKQMNVEILGESLRLDIKVSGGDSECVVMFTIVALMCGAINGAVVNREISYMSALQGLVLGAGIVICLISLFLK